MNEPEKKPQLPELLDIKKRKWQCAAGHEWEDQMFSKSHNGMKIKFGDPRTDKDGQHSIVLGPYCQICLADKIRDLLKGVPLVTEKK